MGSLALEDGWTSESVIPLLLSHPIPFVFVPDVHIQLITTLTAFLI